MLGQLFSRLGQGDHGVFLREWARAPLRTGAVAPSSAALARQMEFAAAIRPGATVVELGPGTGVFTAALIAAGVEEEALTLVELNPEFAGALKTRYGRANVMAQDALSALRELNDRHAKVDAVISGLPLVAFPKDLRRAICEQALKLTGPQGRFVQFTYAPFSPVPRDPGIQAIQSRRVWNNLPPAVVWTYRTKQ